MTLFKWSKTAASNSNADSTINWAEGQAPSSVNDSARAEMAAVAKWRDDITGTITTGGTATAYTVTTNQVFDTAAHMSGAEITFIPHADSGAAPTLAVDGLTARALNASTGVAVPTGYFKTGTPYAVTYIHATTEFIVRNAPAVLPASLVTTASIAASAVTYDKLQNETNNTLLGNVSGGAAAPEEITIGTGLVVSGTTLKAPAFPFPGGFKNLSIKVATSTTVAVAADFVTTTNGTNYQTTAVSSTVNLGTSVVVDALDTGTIAIDKEYHIWAIAQANGTTKCVASLRSTADATFLSNLAAIASGVYTYYARIGAVMTIHGSAQLYGTWQLGRRAQYVVGLAQTTAIPTIGTTVSATMAAMSIVRFVPTTASEVYIWMANSSAGTCAVSPNNQTSATSGLTNPSPLFSSNGATAAGMAGSFILESTSIYGATSSPTLAVYCLGWIDNI